MARVAIVTLGCPKNAVDSEGLAGLLSAGGHDIGSDPSAAEVVVLNTCGFIEPARRETVEEVLELADLKASAGLAGLVLAGCLVARSAGELAEALPEVDAFVDFAAYPRIAEIVGGAAAGSLTSKIHGDPGTRFDPAWWDATIAAAPRLRFGRAPWAYVKIAEGCNRGCTFCSIPLMRGRLRSRAPDDIEAEARALVAQGVAELSLVSQDSVMWGRDSGDGDLLGLLGRLEAIDGLHRLRLMYLHPQGVSDALIDRMISSEVIASYFDLSLQHVAPEILKGMGRWGGRKRFSGLVDRIRAQDPMAGVRSTFILGFPGESEEQAEQVEAFVADTELDWVGAFTYSPEEGTASLGMPEPVAEAVVRARTERVAAAAEITMERRARSLVGNRLEVLAESFDRADGAWSGRSHREAPEIDGEVRFTGGPEVAVGDLLRVRITGNSGADLVGVGERIVGVRRRPPAAPSPVSVGD